MGGRKCVLRTEFCHAVMLSKYFLLIRNTQEIFLAESAQDILQAGRNRFSQNKKI